MEKINSLSDLELDQEAPYFCIIGNDTLDYFVRIGVSGEFLKEFEETYLPLREDLPKILKLSKKRYQSLPRTDQTLPRPVAKELLHITQLMFHGYRTFDNSETSFFGWLHQRNIHLNQGRPLDALKSQEGVATLHRMLGRIEHGVYS